MDRIAFEVVSKYRRVTKTYLWIAKLLKLFQGIE